MTTEERRVRVEVATELLESVMLDIVREVNEQGMSLTLREAIERASMGRYTVHAEGVARYVLERLAKAGKVRNSSGDGRGGGSWSLVSPD